MATSTSFAHRQNRDSSIDSICRKCYRTIASANIESELIAHEQRHLCDPNSVFILAAVDSQRSNGSHSQQPSLARQRGTA